MFLNFQKFFVFLSIFQLTTACTLYRSDGRKEFESGSFASLTLLSCEIIPAAEAKQLSNFIEDYAALHERQPANLVTELILEKNEQFQICIYEKATTSEDSP